MAGVWSGFTEEDIGLYRQNEAGKGDLACADNSNVKKIRNLARKKTSKENNMKKYNTKCATTEETDIPESAKLFKELQASKDSSPNAEVLNDVGKSVEKTENENKADNEKEPEANPVIVGSNPVCLKVIEGKAYELVGTAPDVAKSNLEVFEARQKKLEEENKKRKEMLAKIILDRKKQTLEEANRLQHIQEELQKLDVLLSSDVGILRDKIEAASLDFAEAQKRYNKAEKEFLDAKQNLFGKLEKKELLTRYLCTIIEQNEMRKAQKLSELMEKLEVNENGTVSELERTSALKKFAEGTSSMHPKHPS